MAYLWEKSTQLGSLTGHCQGAASQGQRWQLPTPKGFKEGNN